MALLEASKIDGEWHNAIRSAIASMIGRGWANSMIRMMCKPYCRDGYGDHDLDALIDGAREKWAYPTRNQLSRVPSAQTTSRASTRYMQSCLLAAKPAS